MSTALEFRSVTKRYARTATPALDAFSCRYPIGCIGGLVGPNGAGKTTAFSLVGGYLRAQSGEVDILGMGGHAPGRLKGRLGLLPQDAELGERHTPRELLTHLCRLQGMGRRDARREADAKLDLVALTDRRNRRIGSLSHGMRRRVAAATALLGDPELVLLDEPFAGLDPAQAKRLREALVHAGERRTLVISSHNLGELERVCDWVVMMDAGRCVRQGSIAEVTGQSRAVYWQLGPGDVPLAALRAALPDHRFDVHDDALVQHAPAADALDPSSTVVATTLAAAGVPIRGVQRGASLERTFFEETGDD